MRCFVLGMLFFVVAAANAQETSKPVSQHLQDISVMIETSSGSGSGVIITRDVLYGKNAKANNFILTAAHVVKNLRSVKEKVDPRTGTKRQIISFKDANLVRDFRQGGRKVGDSRMTVSVLKYNEEQDLALLRVHMDGYSKDNTVFREGEEITPLGTELFHVGSMLGEAGTNSFTNGIVSQIGRVLDDKMEYDQTTVTAYPGSSGGGVYTTDGKYVGMLVRGTSSGDNFNLIIPIRRIRKWIVEVKIPWVLDPKADPPTDKQLRDMVIEDTSFDFGTDTATEKKINEIYPYLLYYKGTKTKEGSK